MTPSIQVIPVHSGSSETTAYLVHKPGLSEAIFVDPVPMTRKLYRSILERNLTITKVLITHLEQYMEHALSTLAKVFRFEIITAGNKVFGLPCRALGEFETITAAGLSVTGIHALSHSRESCIFQVDELLFSGSIIQAGTLGETPNAFAEELLIATVKDHLFSNGETRLLLPSVGPPSTIAAEIRLTPFYDDSFIAVEDN